jgi:hypothetical protein
MSEKHEYTAYRGGRTSKRRLGAAMAVASTLSVVALVSFFSIGMVGAAMGVGFGGFVANFDSVNATSGGEIFPVLADQAACDNAPQLQAALDGTAELDDGVEFFKDLPLPTGFGDADFARVSIVASAGANPIQVEGLDLRLTALETDSLKLEDADVREYGPSDYNDGSAGVDADGSYIETDNGFHVDNSDGPTVYNNSEDRVTNPDTGVQSTTEFGINASGGFSLENGTAAAHMVTFGSINLRDLDLFVQILDESANDDTAANGSLARVVNPTERTCEALADRSMAGDVRTNGTSNGGTKLVG